MKKGQIIEGFIEHVEFPNRGVIPMDSDKNVVVKNGIPGQKVCVSINKIRKGKAEGRILEVLQKSSLELDVPSCTHFGSCGGCTYQNLPYAEQLKLKSSQVQKLLDGAIENPASYQFEGIKSSPQQFEYRNKMEFTFGDSFKDGPLTLGMHKQESFYDIISVSECKIVDSDYRQILTCIQQYFAHKHISFYHRLQHSGYLRHLLVRKAVKTGEILIDLVTASADSLSGNAESEDILLNGMTKELLSLNYTGTITGILHTRNNSVADTVTNEGTRILFGKDFFYEELLGLQFKISPFSFFQTNSLGAEILYDTARSYIGDSLTGTADKIVFDLYSGTGTIAQLLSPVAKKVVGVEIVPEAVEAARENARQNRLTNCEFIAGDVLKILDTLEERPDFIVLDPPRDGIHPKALEKIIRYGVERMIYISCKPTSLARDLKILQENGYYAKRACCVDMFPGTVHVESVCLLEKNDK